MTDPTLRMPDTVFRAVLDLGDLPLEAPPLPTQFRNPVLNADWFVDGEGEADEEEVAVFSLGFEGGELHLETTPDGVEHHFHGADGEETDRSPWPKRETKELVAWALALVKHTLPLLEDLAEDAEEAADWHHEGLRVYARDFGAVPLEIVDVAIPGEQMMLPWLGSGRTDHLHTDDEARSLILTWNPEDADPETPIVRAWLDAGTGEPVSEAVAGVDWVAVGLPEEEVRAWFEAFYLNHEVLDDPAELIMRAALNRIAGLG
ncbi:MULTISPECIES: hypothetical protein [Cryobacterium]|uniref:Uncharacterized protein n=2 Tax=Cryobacterium TaxID=69578 RepID=A0ABY2IV88_9MICO|nr:MULTISPECIES: hypothetical protein [Cryobacterium]MDY7529754.1 hypothetical protein [Cryobacterium sp. 10C2]MEB0001855.1 hypothetical protein [Cryobacterium sp. RTC2.1]MEB0202819.1 hypothetical protein [Cryobacterium sp. 5I3]MEB0286010.1 hypothetical protein [Cryobacterium sp. 10S3]MEB0289484.1 hypothetical protein [Cryobacterium sp. 10C2]